jgi:HD-like signal output (HDOD) protein
MNLIPTENELSSAFDAIRGIEIPKIPEAVIDLQKELLKSDPNMSNIGNILSTDPVLAGRVLKTVNSAKFGLPRKIESINQATMLLGLSEIKNVIMVAALKASLGESSTFQSYIWQSSQAIALGAKAMSFAIDGVSAESAYLAGLFQNIGALILEKKSDEYSTNYIENLACSVSCLSKEDSQYGTNHAIIGFLLAKNWQLPEKTCIAIYHSHAESCSEFEDPEVKALVAMLNICENSTNRLIHSDIQFCSESYTSLAKCYLELAIDCDALIEMDYELTQVVD